MRYLFSQRIPPFDRVLLVESGSRGIFNRLVPLLYEKMPAPIEIDLLTCYPGVPEGFRGRLYRVEDYPDAPSRRRLLRELVGNQYSLAGIICSGQPIMTKWKWLVAGRLPAKIFLVNENADFLFLDWAHRRNALWLMKARTGLGGAASIPALASVIVFPFALVYLLLFAGVVHLRRLLRRNVQNA